jgi:phosphoribosylformylglycinamidine cyclo-ligase
LGFRESEPAELVRPRLDPASRRVRVESGAADRWSTNVMTKASSYARAGVDIDVMMEALSDAKAQIKSTTTRGVIRGMGGFGAIHVSPGRNWLLVSSIDGVGTKLKVAQMAGIHHTVGQDLVNHCVNDILTVGARPLFFLDYLGTAKLDPPVFSEILDGICKACEANACALIGGETAEMPGLYREGEYDLVGTVVGAVRRPDAITGSGIRAGDILIGLQSHGLHTNGYSLARKVIFDDAGLQLDDVYPGTRRRVDAVMLRVHKCYLQEIQAIQKTITVRGIAHITGGGLVDNVPRIMPEGLYAEIDRRAWKVLPVFQFIQEAGSIPEEEMYRVFNMGIGMVVVLRLRDVRRAMRIFAEAGAKPFQIGRVKEGNPGVRFI